MTTLVAPKRPLGEILRGKTFRRNLHRAVSTLVIAVGACGLMLPILWMLRTALMHPGKVFIQPVVWIPNPPRFSNFVEVLTTIPFFMYARNSALVSILTVLGTVLSSSMVAYAFARLRAPDKNILFMIVLATLMLPGEVVMIPQYLLFRALGWLDSYRPLIIPAYFGGGAFSIFLLRQFFMTIPTELDDAAKIDGASLFRTYWTLMLPLSKPALATVAIFTFFGCWNDFMGPLIYVDSQKLWTLPLGLKIFAGSGVLVRPQWTLLMASSLLTMLPPTIVFFAAQRTFVQGIVLTGIKG